MKIIDFWRNPIFSSNENTNFLLEPKAENQKFEIEEKVMSERVKMPVRHFLRRDYLYLCYSWLSFFRLYPLN